MLRSFVVLASLAMSDAAGKMGATHAASTVTPEAIAATRAVWPAFGQMAMAQGRNGILGDFKEEALVSVSTQVNIACLVS